MDSKIFTSFNLIVYKNMNNEAFAGFLLKKTIQNFPIREETDGDFNEYRDRNIIIYL